VDFCGKKKRESCAACTRKSLWLKRGGKEIRCVFLKKGACDSVHLSVRGPGKKKKLVRKAEGGRRRK